MSEEREFLTPEQAEALLPEGELIHTFRQAGPAMLGCNWDRNEVLALLRTLKPELAGPGATALDHGLVVFDATGPLFIGTKKKNSDA